MQQEGEYIKIDVLKILNGMVRRIGLIIIAMLLCGAIAFSWAAFFIAPSYESTVLMYVNNSSFSVGATNFSISSSEISAAKSLVDTYIVILKTRMTLNEVISTGELDYSYENLKKMIEAESVSGTEVFSITVTSKDPQEAEHIANTIGLVLPGKIADVVEGSSVRIVDYAVVPAKKSAPSISKFTMVGLILGFLISCAAVAVIEIRDNTIHSEEYLLTNYKNIPLLSVIPDLLEKKGNGYRGYYNYYSAPDDEGESEKNSKSGRK